MISPADLPLNADGSVYHLGLRPDDLADTVLTVGDPDRVPQVSRHFDAVTVRRQRREFVAHTGTRRGRRLTVISSGMGTDNVEILLTELDALANVDLGARQPRAARRTLDIIRLGTAGALRPETPLGSLLVAGQAVGLDALAHYYPVSVGVTFDKALQTHLGLPFAPYVAPAAPPLLNAFAHLPTGTAVTCPGFYAPQGRRVRLPPRWPDLPARLRTFSGLRLTHFEMETAGYYALGRLLGHRVLSVSALLANRATDTFAPYPTAAVDAMIEAVLEGLLG